MQKRVASHLSKITINIVVRTTVILEGRKARLAIFSERVWKLVGRYNQCSNLVRDLSLVGYLHFEQQHAAVVSSAHNVNEKNSVTVDVFHGRSLLEKNTLTTYAKMSSNETFLRNNDHLCKT